MDNTAQNQNNNPQFQYPDFSSNQPATAAPTTTPTPVQQTNEDPKLAELRESLNALMEHDAVKTETPAPTVSVETVAATPTIPSPLPPEPIMPVDVVVEPKSYIQQPTPLPNLSQDLSIPDTSVLAKEIELPSQDSFVNTALPEIPKNDLDSIMPSDKKPKAMVREPKSNNLAQPVEVDEEMKENLRKEIDSIQTDQDLNSLNKTPDVPVNPQVGLHIGQLLSEAINRNASDLHITVGYPPILRIDGELVDLDEKVLGPEDVEELLFELLSDEKKELLEVNREIDFAHTHQGAVTARFRVNAFYTMKNLSAAFRLIPSRVRTVEELMLPQIYHQLAKLKQGLVLVTGPTGHGKSTTLAAILEDINRTRFCHIVTIEDPVEYVFEGKKALIDQREMNDDTHSWNIALRSALRQDPDVILVGEMRDYETIAAAITLAETGHLVFATLHTNSAAQTVDRIIDVFPENQQQQVRAQIANTLEAVVAQRLIPLEKGGRRAVSEIMLNNSAIANLIREGKAHQIDNVIRTSSDVGMVYLEKALVTLVREGVISVQRAQEYAVHPEEVLRLLKS